MIRADILLTACIFAHSSGLKKVLNDWLEDGAYYCYCAYVLRISRYSDFLSPMLTNTGIFLRGLKLSGESRSQWVLSVSKKKIGGNHAFLRDN